MQEWEGALLAAAIAATVALVVFVAERIIQWRPAVRGGRRALRGCAPATAPRRA